MDKCTWIRCFLVGFDIQHSKIFRDFHLHLHLHFQSLGTGSLSLIMLLLHARQMSASDFWLQNFAAAMTSAARRMRGECRAAAHEHRERFVTIGSAVSFLKKLKKCGFFCFFLVPIVFCTDFFAYF